MATRQEWAHQLAKRCEAIGWKVEEPHGRQSCYSVTCPPCPQADCNHTYGLHLSTSDYVSEKIALTFFKRHGLIRRETALANSKKAVAAQRNKEEREAAERKAEEIAKKAQAEAANRAAGPYGGPEYVDDAWFIADHPAPVTRTVIMTPRQAAWLFDEYNTSNRPFYRHTRDRYYDIIMAGKWRLTHQGMAMDWNRVLQDGQHRLSAIAKAGIEVPAMFTCGADPENFKAIDEGLNRTGAQLIGKDGHSNIRVLSSLVKVIWVYDKDSRGAMRYKLTNAEIYEGFEGDKERIKAASLAGHRYYHAAMVKSTNPNATAISSAYYLITRACGDGNPYIDAFFRGLARERKLDGSHALVEGDPRIRLRAYIGNARAQRKNVATFDQLCLIIIAWNHVIEGRRREYLRWAANQSIPRITLIAADSACPSLLEGELEVRELASVS